MNPVVSGTLLAPVSLQQPAAVAYTGCVIGAIALSSHLQMLVLPVRPGSFAPMLLKWAALGMGLLCGAAFSRYRGTPARLSASMKRRVAAGVASIGAAVLGISSLAATGILPGATRWLSEGGVVVFSMGAVLALAAGVWAMLALSGQAPTRNVCTAALTLLVLCIALCGISTCVFCVMQTGWPWLRPVAESMLKLSTSVSRVTASACLWWLACAVLMLAALGRHRDAA